MLSCDFFARDARVVAPDLLGCMIKIKTHGHWLSARIIETEAYCLDDKASHASLGFTEKRRALFMPPGTIYMYYARGGDSFNISCLGDGDAVLIKSAFPDRRMSPSAISIMQKLNPLNGRERPFEKLCAGQTLLCRALDIKVPDWDQQQFSAAKFYCQAPYDPVKKIIKTTRLGIPSGRDEHLFYRYIDYDYADYCTSNPLRKRSMVEDRDYDIYS